MKSFAHVALNCKGLEMIDLVKADTIDVRAANCGSYAPFGTPDCSHGQPSFELKISATQKG
jgi:hypothetical protein